MRRLGQLLWAAHRYPGGMGAPVEVGTMVCITSAAVPARPSRLVTYCHFFTNGVSEAQGKQLDDGYAGGMC